MAEKWAERELELSRKHEELLLRREALLRGTETYYDTQEERAASFITDFKKAKERNEDLARDLRDVLNDLKKETSEVTTPKFSTLKNNYWTMVKQVFPLWYEEQQDYNHRHSLTTQTKTHHGNQQLPQQPSPRQPSPRLQQRASRPQSQPSPRHSARQHSPRRSARQHSPNPPGRNSREDMDLEDENTMSLVPPLDLDFSLGSDVTSMTLSATKSSMRDKYRDPEVVTKSKKKVRYVDEAVDELPKSPRHRKSSKSKSGKGVKNLK